MAEDSTQTADTDHGIDIWYRNPNTGLEFGFGLPLPEAIATQVRSGALVACRPDTPGLSSPNALEAAGADGDGTGDDEAILHPCLDCGDTAVRVDGEWTEHCAAHQPKPAKPAAANTRRAKP